ncbi:hypothetical protein K501DRAFT_268999 [Backusella circina FSU 941]|nr:hypothetical protein K501DRAFT_268999 [Backusella circina FSU 941]
MNMGSETIYFTFDTQQSKLSAPLSTKVPEQTDWHVSDFHQTVTSGYNFDHWYTPSYNTSDAPHEALLDVLSLIEQKQKKYNECWRSEHEDSVISSSLPELDEGQSDDDDSIITNSDDKCSYSIETNSTLVLSRTSTLKYNQNSIISNCDSQHKPVKQSKFPKRVNSFIFPLKHLFTKKQRQHSTFRSSAPVASIFSKYFMK